MRQQPFARYAHMFIQSANCESKVHVGAPWPAGGMQVLDLQPLPEGKIVPESVPETIPEIIRISARLPAVMMHVILGALEILARSKSWRARNLGALEILARSKSWRARNLATVRHSVGKSCKHFPRKHVPHTHFPRMPFPRNISRFPCNRFLRKHFLNDSAIVSMSPNAGHHPWWNFTYKHQARPLHCTTCCV